MNIVKANINHIDDILKLLKEVSHVHHLIRPDIFKEGTKYNKEQSFFVYPAGFEPARECVRALWKARRQR